ncbi:MAG: hypothetical protein IPG76_00110 [Acidobacteria bacterium]|nr:hypothetical protein [Acidobacteriota bacterium]
MQRILHARDSAQAITTAAVTAHREMMRTSIDQFFRMTEPPIEFTEWLPLASTDKERTVYYRVRALDLFGRTSQWTGPKPVKITHATAPTAVMEFRSSSTGTGPDERLDITWRLGPKQLQSGAPIKEFRVLWKDYDPRDLSRRYADWQANILARVPYAPHEREDE